jgi:glycosyltransferase involved in cell wall biosynthesis
MILIVAPYSPANCGNPHLGAARKLEGCIEALLQLDPDIVLLNTAQQPPYEGDGAISINGTEVKVVSVRKYKVATWGKFINIFQVRRDIDSIIKKFGLPEIVWVYNAYSYEMLSIRRLAALGTAVRIVEFEDWIFARFRGINPKPIFDYICWIWSRRFITFAFCVNSTLINKVSNLNIKASLLPGIVPDNFGVMEERTLNKEGELVVGYFGGLNEEKGLPMLLGAVGKTSHRFIICGSGPLESMVRVEAEHFKGRLDYFKNVDGKVLFDLYAKCHVIVNPHRVSADMLSGLFPSKVLEAIGSGAVVVSTELPRLEGSNILDAVCFVRGSSLDLAECLNSLALSYPDFLRNSRMARDEVMSKFSISAVANRIGRLITRKL